MPLRLISFLGLAAMVLLAWVLSENRKHIDWRLVGIGVTLQAFLGLIILRTDAGNRFFDGVGTVFGILGTASQQGASFVFGKLSEIFVLNPQAVAGADEPVLINAIFAFSVLPVVIVASSLAGILYHLRIIQAVVRGMAWLMQKTLRTSGAETFGAAMLVFLGIESMPSIKGYLHTMTRSELLTLMTAFMATVAASVLFAYASFGASPGHLLAASIMSAPAAIVISKILVPETETPVTQGGVKIEVEVESHNVMDGAARGAAEGVTLALNIGALIIAMISIVYLINQGMSAITGYTFTEVMGWFFIPFAWLMGIPSQDVPAVAQLLGTKTVLNEFLAYAELQPLIDSGQLQPRSITIATYALCGFANPGSLGILIAGLSGLAPERRSEIAGLGIKSFAAGTLAVFMTACIAGILS
ncbi:MAG: NupC/NupG family nucleoside CNT transporter [Candidatus Hydrogenedentota bacterium]|nr:MAG: NupC/NupG family nucleoside CNT transporter [Candidatus Hydrogenedentota bacterium]